MKRMVAVLMVCVLIFSFPLMVFAKDPHADNATVQEYRNFIISLNEQFPDANLDVDYHVKRALEIDQLSEAEKREVIESDLAQGPIAKYTSVSAEGVTRELVVFKSGDVAGCDADIGTVTINGNRITYTGTDVWCYFTMGSKRLVSGYVCNHTSESGISEIIRPVSGYAPSVFVSLILYSYAYTSYDFGSYNTYCKKTGTWGYVDPLGSVFTDVVFIGVKFDTTTFNTTLYL